MSLFCWRNHRFIPYMLMYS